MYRKLCEQLGKLVTSQQFGRVSLAASDVCLNINFNTVAAMMFEILLFYLTVALSEQQKIVVDSRNGNDKMCNHSISNPCKTLHTALELAETMRHNDSTLLNTTIQINSGNYSYNTTSSRTLSFSNATITGNGSNVTIVECNNSGTGFGFINVSNMSISRLTLSGCGQLRNSTTKNTSNSVMLFRAALYFVNVVNVTIDDVTVSESIGMGVAMYDVTGDVMVYNSTFRNNRVPSHELGQYPGGGGFSVEFTFCKPWMSDPMCNDTMVNSDALYSFVDCTFKDNKATVTDNVKYTTTAFGTGYTQFGRGGGLSVFFKGEATRNKVMIDNTKFVNNSAIWGTGYHSDFLDCSADNQLIITSSSFINNHCYYNNSIYGIGTGGGGIRIALHYYNSTTHDNRIDIRLCYFMENSASYGGGVSFSTVRQTDMCLLNYTISFKQCVWSKNVARTGSGVDLNVHVFPQGLVAPVRFEDCRFTENTNVYVKGQPVSLLGIGSLYSDAVPVKFYGKCELINNTGGAMAATASTLTFCQDSFITFENNTGHHGGGIALLGNAYMLVEKNTSLNFSGNKAKAKGGAIFSLSPSERDFVSTKKCFVHYEDYNVAPSNWSTSFRFRNNSAMAGNSIYVTTLLPCIWNGPPDQYIINKTSIKEVLHWNGKFDYGDSSLTFEISTEPLDVRVEGSKIINIPPGKLYDMSVTPTDDKMDDTTAVFLVQTESENDCVSVDPTSNYSSNGTIKLRGRCDTQFNLTLQTVGVRPLQVTFKAKLVDCPPGYYIDGEGDEATCKCSSYSHQKYYGISKCDEEEFVAYIRPQIWAGYNTTNTNSTRELLTGDCPAGYCDESGSSLIPLDKKDLDTLLCKPKKRKDRLCGSCMDDHYIYINSPTYECGKCDSFLSKYGVLFLILLKFVPMTVFLCIIMFFNISLVDGPLNAFILFSQILSAADLYAGGAIKHPVSGEKLADNLITFYLFLYNIWNLNYFETLTHKFCGWRYNSALPILLLEYVSAIYPVVLFLLFFSILPWLFSKLSALPIRCIQNSILSLERCCIRFRAGWSVKNSIIHGLVTFLVLSYVKFTAVSWRILAFGTVYGPGGELSNTTVIVARFDGTYRYFGDDHGKYAAVALVFLICFVFVAPLFLLSYPYLPKLLNKLKIDDRWVIQTLVLKPLGHAIPFFDVIQGCFKDEFRFFAAFYFIYRIIAWAIFSFSPTVREHYVWQIGFYIVILFLHSFCQPYKKRWHNMVDASIFSLLILINAVSFYRYSGFLADLSASPKAFWFQLVLIYCPLIYFAAFVLKYCFKCGRPRVRTLIRQLSGRNDYQVFQTRNESSAEFPARLLYDDTNRRGSTDNDQNVELKNSAKWSGQETPVLHNASAAAATDKCPSTIQDYGSTKSTS